MLWVRAVIGYFVLFFVLGLTALMPVMASFMHPAVSGTFIGSQGLLFVSQASNAAVLVNASLLPLALVSSVLAGGAASKIVAVEKVRQELQARGWQCHNCINYKKRWLGQGFYCFLTSRDTTDVETCESHEKYREHLRRTPHPRVALTTPKLNDASGEKPADQSHKGSTPDRTVVNSRDPTTWRELEPLRSALGLDRPSDTGKIAKVTKCPHCGNPISLPSTAAGTKVTCSNCGKSLQIKKKQ